MILIELMSRCLLLATAASRYEAGPPPRQMFRQSVHHQENETIDIHSNISKAVDRQVVCIASFSDYLFIILKL